MFGDNDDGDIGAKGGGDVGDREPAWFVVRIDLELSLGSLVLSLGLFLNDCSGCTVGDAGDNGAFEAIFSGGRYNRGLPEDCFNAILLPTLPLLLER